MAITETAMETAIMVIMVIMATVTMDMEPVSPANPGPIDTHRVYPVDEHR